MRHATPISVARQQFIHRFRVESRLAVPDTSRTVTKSPRIDPAARAVGKRVKELREAADMTQEDLGHKAKLSAKFISQVETGQANPSIGVVARLSAALDLPLSAFFAREAPSILVDDLAAVTALVSSQPPTARKRALRVLRALFDE